MQMEITKEVAAKVLEVVDAGLVNGVGVAEPGQMCVEAAVCFAMGLPHGDNPPCVAQALRSLKIALNDSGWSSTEARARGLRRLAVVQLGSKDNFDEVEFAKLVSELAIRKQVPIALRAAASVHRGLKQQVALNAAADKCEQEGTQAASGAANEAARAARAAGEAARAARAAGEAAREAASWAASWAAGEAARAAGAAARAAGEAACDKVLADFAEDVVQILIDMGAPGCQWLPLTETNS